MQQLFAQNIGIGTASPTGKLEVEYVSGPDNPQLKLIESSNDNFVRLVMKNKNFPTYWTIASNNTTPSNKDVLAFYHSNKGEIFQIDGNGNMGIGRPASIGGLNAKLSIDGGATQSAFYASSATNTILQPAVIAEDKTTGGTGGVAIYTLSSAGIALLASSGSKAIITTGGGKSGFGILNPLEMVEVNGAIKIGNTSSTNAGTIRYTGTDFQGYVGGEWRSLVGGAASTQWVLNGNNITNSNTGNVGIGGDPAAGNKLDVTNANANGTAINANGATGVAATSTAGLAGSFNTATGTAILANVTNASGKGLIVLGGKAGFGVLNPTEQVDVNGGIRVGSTTSTNPGTIRYNGSDLQGYVDGQWKSLTNAAGAQWVANGNNISNSNTGNVGLGISTPTAPLHVYKNVDVWHSFIGGETGRLQIGGQTPTGAVIQSWNPTTNVARDLYLQRDGGGVGIGTTAVDPNAKIHILFPNSDNFPSIKLESQQTDKGFGINFTNPNGRWFFGNNIGNNNDGRMSLAYASFNASTGIYSYQPESSLNLATNGNLGVGWFYPFSIGPQQRLEVNGAIYFKDTAVSVVAANGTMRYNSTQGFQGKHGDSWQNLGGSGSSPWTTSGNNISNSNTGNVGIGTGGTTPAARLDVNGNGIFSAISSLSQPQLVLAEQQSGNFSRLNFKNINQSSYWTIAGLNTNSAAGDLLNFYHSTAGDVLSISGDKKATINGSLNIATAGGTALTIDNGFIKVAGSNRTAFQVVSSADNTSGNATSLSYPNASTTDIVTVTPVWTGTYLNSPIGIYFTSGEWRVFRQDLVTMPNGITFNVIVIKQ
jgi:hypothetical protein